MIQPVHEELKKLLAYWLSKKGDRIAPSRSDIDPAEITQLLPYVALVDVLHDPLRFRFRLAGTEIAMSYGLDLTGRYLDEIDLDGHQHEILLEYEKVTEQGVAVCKTWEYTRQDGRHIRYERLALPLSSDGKTVDMLFGGVIFDLAFNYRTKQPSKQSSTLASKPPPNPRPPWRGESALGFPVRRTGR